MSSVIYFHSLHVDKTNIYIVVGNSFYYDDFNFSNADVNVTLKLIGL